MIKILPFVRIFLFIIVQFIVSICRVFSDIVEKYLLEYNYLDPYKILTIKNTLEMFPTLFLYILGDSRNEIIPLLENDNKFKTFFGIILLILYFGVSGFKNIYKTLTIKAYSPMARTIFDSILDIFIYFWNSRKSMLTKSKDSLILWIYIFCKIIIIFFNLIYNEILVLYCCGMEENTHLEIQRRSESIELPENILNDSINNLQRDSIL